MKSEISAALSGISARVFNDQRLRQTLDEESYDALRKAQETGEPMSKPVKNRIADAIGQWAMSQGATSFAHWFQPTRGLNAEKLDSFIDLNYKTKEIVVEFSGSKLFQGETDGSSYPNGGLRETHTAAAHTAWDTTSPPFLRNNTLYIPAAFISWTGEALDEKTPLLRADTAVNREAVRLLKLIGDDETTRVDTNVGWEQEFFVIDRELYLERPDLVASGRTLLGAAPSRGQQTDANYFGRIPLRTQQYLADVREELWALGISINCVHNEVAPSQHELSPIFSLTNVASDQNTLAMEVMQEMATSHGLCVLFHEKPFAGLNGSGKHNNWGLNTNTGGNIFNPGTTVEEQRRFVVFTTALVRALHLHGDVLRVGIASASNDHRLGAQEAPPAIISLYLGEGLDSHLRKVMEGGNLEGYTLDVKKTLEFGTPAVNPISASMEDRNRTAPFPFCGNRFEFRAVGGSQNISFPNTLLNTAMAESIKVLADAIDGGKSVEDAVRDMLKEHYAVVFNGNGYSDEWVTEAESRGLYNLRTSAQAISTFNSEKNRKLFDSMNVFTPRELEARSEILFERYTNEILMEANCMLDMLQTGVLPAVMEDANTYKANEHIFNSKNHRVTELAEVISALETAVDKFPADGSAEEQAHYCADNLKIAMETARSVSDRIERTVDAAKWPFPTYESLLYSHHNDEAREA